MGRGDIKTAKGKRYHGSHGNSRPKSGGKKQRTKAMPKKK